MDMITREQEVAREFAHSAARGEEVTCTDQDLCQRIASLLIAWKVEFVITYADGYWSIKESN